MPNQPEQARKTLADWLQYLERLHPAEIKLGLDRVGAVADRMKLDFSGHTVITIAGTNGKGSTAAFLEKLLASSGKAVGVYRSPHLLHYNERITVRGQPVNDTLLCQAFAAIEAKREEIPLTYFEFGTLAALQIFAEAGLDCLILEVGLGGRLDAVNILDADIALITNIALDHTEWLGDNREAIGLEKAGIMRAGKPVLFGDTDMPDSVRQHAEKLGALLYCSGSAFQDSLTDNQWHWQGFDAKGRKHVLDMNISGDSLLQSFCGNAALALQAFVLLEEEFEPLQLEEALRNTRIPGRFQLIPRTYTLVLDVAHNPHAAQKLLANIRHSFAGKKLHVLLAMLQGKDHQEFVKILAPQVQQWFLAGLENSRGTATKILYNALQNSGQKRIAVYDTVPEAFQAAEASLDAEDVLLVTGSFYTVAGVLEQI